MEAYGTVSGDKKVAERRKLLNPMNYIGTDKQADAADYIRIRVGTEDGNTSFSISAILALELENNTDNRCGLCVSLGAATWRRGL